MRYQVVPKEFWKNKKTGATASIFGSVPWTSETDKKNWHRVKKGYSLHDSRENRRFGNNYPPYTWTKAEAQKAAAKLEVLSTPTRKNPRGRVTSAKSRKSHLSWAALYQAKADLARILASDGHDSNSLAAQYFKRKIKRLEALLNSR